MLFRLGLKRRNLISSEHVAISKLLAQRLHGILHLDLQRRNLISGEHMPISKLLAQRVHSILHSTFRLSL